jgi:beta-N-acetylhexosaminidase
MDKSIGTYMCTFDFTETAMASLVRALYGNFVPQGSMPGTMRKSKKVLKNRQRWLVENYERERDGQALDELLKVLARASTPSLPYSACHAHAFDLFNPNVEEAHFVVRNSSTQALYGFAATYYTKGMGAIGAIFVDPSKRNVSIGNSLHRRAMKVLLSKPGLNKVRLGVSFPGVFPGIPVEESGSAKSWFANVGWDVQFPRRVSNLAITDLSSWSAPEGLPQSLQRHQITFDLITGLENGETVLNHVATHANPDVVELYRYALQSSHDCGIVRAKSTNDSLLGTVIVTKPGSILAAYIPLLNTATEGSYGGIIAPIVPATAQSALLLQGLVFMGVRQNKGHKSAKSIVSWVSRGPHIEMLISANCI